MPEQPPPAPDPLELDDWRDLLGAALRFRDAAPWNHMADSPVIGVRDPETGEIGYASVLGAAGEVSGLLVFRGPEGFWAHSRANASSRSPWDAHAALVMAPMLAFTLGERDKVPREEREVFKTLGLHFRGAAAWPVFRSHRPGYLPWRLTRAEARSLAAALAATTAFTRTPAGPSLLDEVGNGDGPPAGPRPVVVLTRGPAGAWRAGVEEVEPRPALPIDSGFDRTRARRLAAGMRRRGGAWELDLRPGPFGIGAAGERLAAAWVGLAVDHESGLILHMEAYSARERLRPSRFVLDAVEQAGWLPGELRLCTRGVADALVPLGEALGCALRRTLRVPYLEAAWQELLASRR